MIGALSPDSMYQAVVAADPSYDGRFFFAVVTTGVFCFPSCSCRKPRRENVRFFATRQEALAAGFRPCKRCRPDLERGRRDAEGALLRQVDEYLDRHLETATPERLAAAVALSLPYFQRLFRRLTGQTPHMYITAKRTGRAADLLRSTDMPVLAVAGAAGFESASVFYDAFRRTTGMPPGQYRRTCTEGDAPCK